MSSGEVSLIFVRRLNKILQTLNNESLLINFSSSVQATPRTESSLLKRELLVFNSFKFTELAIIYLSRSSSSVMVSSVSIFFIFFAFFSILKLFSFFISTIYSFSAKASNSSNTAMLPFT